MNINEFLKKYSRVINEDFGPNDHQAVWTLDTESPSGLFELHDTNNDGERAWVLQWSGTDSVGNDRTFLREWPLRSYRALDPERVHTANMESSKSIAKVINMEPNEGAFFGALKKFDFHEV